MCICYFYFHSKILPSFEQVAIERKLWKEVVGLACHYAFMFYFVSPLTFLGAMFVSGFMTAVITTVTHQSEVKLPSVLNIVLTQKAFASWWLASPTSIVNASHLQCISCTTVVFLYIPALFLISHHIALFLLLKLTEGAGFTGTLLRWSPWLCRGTVQINQGCSMLESIQVCFGKSRAPYSSMRRVRTRCIFILLLFHWASSLGLEMYSTVLDYATVCGDLNFFLMYPESSKALTRAMCCLMHMFIAWDTMAQNIDLDPCAASGSGAACSTSWNTICSPPCPATSTLVSWRLSSNLERTTALITGNIIDRDTIASSALCVTWTLMAPKITQAG